MTSVGHKDWLEISLTKGDHNNFVNEFTTTFNLRDAVEILPFQTAADVAAKVIASQYNNLYLALSGGLDSEFVAEVLLRNQINFTPVVISGPWNQLETWYAFNFCDNHNLTPKILDYNESSSYHSLIKRIGSYSVRLQLPFLLTMLPLVIANEIEDGHLINGSGEIFYDSKSYHEPTGSLLNFVSYNHCLEIEHGRRHPGAFFSYTPELFRAGIADIDITKNSQVAKSQLYNIPFRPKMHNEMFGYYPNQTLDTAINSLRTKLPLIKHSRIQRDDLLSRLT